MRWFLLILAAVLLSACSMFSDNGYFSGHSEHWRGKTNSIPVVELPMGMRASQLQSRYRVPPAPRGAKTPAAQNLLPPGSHIKK